MLMAKKILTGAAVLAAACTTQTEATMPSIPEMPAMPNMPSFHMQGLSQDEMDEHHKSVMDANKEMMNANRDLVNNSLKETMDMHKDFFDKNVEKKPWGLFGLGFGLSIVVCLLFSVLPLVFIILAFVKGLAEDDAEGKRDDYDQLFRGNQLVIFVLLLLFGFIFGVIFGVVLYTQKEARVKARRTRENDDIMRETEKAHAGEYGAAV